jgi:hypothetical protein
VGVPYAAEKHWFNQHGIETHKGHHRSAANLPGRIIGRGSEDGPGWIARERTRSALRSWAAHSGSLPCVGAKASSGRPNSDESRGQDQFIDREVGRYPHVE